MMQEHIDFLGKQLQKISTAQLQKNCFKEVIQHKDHAAYPFLYGKYALMITTLEPENDIHTLLDCFEQFNQYPLVIVGNWKQNAYTQALYQKYEQYRSLYLLDPLIQLRTLNMLRANCYVYIDAYRTLDETASLIEAMYLQLPIIAFDSLYNKTLTSYKAMYYKSPSELLEALKLLHPTKAVENGAVMKQVIEQKLGQHKNNLAAIPVYRDVSAYYDGSFYQKK